MTKIKLCGLTRPEDIDAANELRPDFVGFVFAQKSKRYIAPEIAAELKKKLCKSIQVVGVFVDEPIEAVAKLLREGIIDAAQLHGSEDDTYIRKLKQLTGKSVIKAFRIDDATEVSDIENCIADDVLLDSGAGSGETFEWDFVKSVKRPFFLAGGLDPHNVEAAVKEIHPFAVDVSSGIETDGFKDGRKMAEFVAAVRRGEIS
ncbi:MAG: phosphoribosylanthranilate isomerase [bacterium]|nr:phosphoribosylanthranilate isomerase [bacterium]